MEFKSLKNIETSFRQIRLFSMVFLALCAVGHIIPRETGQGDGGEIHGGYGIVRTQLRKASPRTRLFVK